VSGDSSSCCPLLNPAAALFFLLTLWNLGLILSSRGASPSDRHSASPSQSATSSPQSTTSTRSPQTLDVHIVADDDVNGGVRLTSSSSPFGGCWRILALLGAALFAALFELALDAGGRENEYCCRDVLTGAGSSGVEMSGIPGVK
jgi:hypothetical protein